MHFRDVVYTIIEQDGIGILQDKSRFLAFVADLGVDFPRERRFLLMHADSQYLGFFLEGTDPERMKAAASRAEMYLVDNKMVSGSMAHNVSSAIAEAVARYLEFSMGTPKHLAKRKEVEPEEIVPPSSEKEEIPKTIITPKLETAAGDNDSLAAAVTQMTHAEKRSVCFERILFWRRFKKGILLYIVLIIAGTVSSRFAPVFIEVCYSINNAHLIGDGLLERLNEWHYSEPAGKVVVGLFLILSLILLAWCIHSEIEREGKTTRVFAALEYFSVAALFFVYYATMHVRFDWIQMFYNYLASDQIPFRPPELFYNFTSSVIVMTSILLPLWLLYMFLIYRLSYCKR